MHLSQDIKSYENLQNSLALLKIINYSERQMREGKVTEQKEVFDSIEKKILFLWRRQCSQNS